MVRPVLALNSSAFDCIPDARSASNSPTIRFHLDSFFRQRPARLCRSYPQCPSLLQSTRKKPAGNQAQSPPRNASGHAARNERRMACLCHDTDPTARVQRSTPVPSARFTISIRSPLTLKSYKSTRHWYAE
jgi:hypothetical protein